MTHSRLLKTLLLSTTLLGSACVAESDSTDQTDPSVDGTIVHMMPLHNPVNEGVNGGIVSAATPHLQFFGGPVLKNVHVVPVFWNANTAFQSNLNSFYAAVTGSALYTMIRQYSSIGLGNAQAGVVDSRGTGSFSDSSIRTELNNLFAAGRLPLPNSNNYYPVHFPAGVKITAPDGSQSCVQFCAYHGTYVRSGVNVNYGIIPDIGSPGCSGGCGGSTTVNNTDSVASHELVEATTDPAVGLATTFAAPLAWYDPNNGEIGDICNAIQGTAAGFVVQKEWSNAVNACVDH